MQRNNTNNSTKLNNNKSGYKTFCKVCQDSGKTEKEYTNHNVRDVKGKTVCPVLLAQECRNCYKHGHTFKYCPLVKAETKAVNKKPYEEPVKVVQKKSKNVFMLLDSDSESDNEVEEVVNEFPVLNQQETKQEKQPLNYSRLINMPEQQIKTEVKKELVKAEIKVLPLPKLVQRGKLDWATAESDSEGDEDEEDYYPVKQQVKEDMSAW
jgi:hypothetical protein